MSAISSEKIKIESKYKKEITCVLTLAALSLIFSSIYTYLGAMGAHFPNWGSPLLITMGSVGIISSLGFVAFTSLIVKLAYSEKKTPYKKKEQDIRRGKALAISVLVYAILGVFVSISYIYLGSLNGQFSQSANIYLITMGSIGIISTICLAIFMVILFHDSKKKNILKLSKP